MNFSATLRCAALAFALLFATSASAQTPSKTVVVRVYEWSDKLYIAYGNGKTEVQDMGNTLVRKNQQPVTEQLQSVIDRLYNEGYTLTAATSASRHERDMISTYIFRKQ
ncbi:hypothetical protein [Hymenobacter oligotrophus]|nr:hypothetical protein [Hymenobacter oligotrophus]